MVKDNLKLFLSGTGCDYGDCACVGYGGNRAYDERRESACGSFAYGGHGGDDYVGGVCDGHASGVGASGGDCGVSVHGGRGP